MFLTHEGIAWGLGLCPPTWSQSLPGAVEEGEAVAGVSDLVSYLWRESSPL